MRKILVTDVEKCYDCRVCELICSAVKEGVFNRRFSRIRLVNIEPIIDVAVTCRLCEDPPCIKSCPNSALHQRDNGTIAVDEAKCDGCSWCIEACDFGAITLNPEGKAMICDLCGGEPKCIEWCPTKALELVTPTTVAQKARISVLKRIFSGIRS